MLLVITNNPRGVVVKPPRIQLEGPVFNLQHVHLVVICIYMAVLWLHMVVTIC
jgi:hypothetical protein